MYACGNTQHMLTITNGSVLVYFIILPFFCSNIIHFFIRHALKLKYPPSGIKVKSEHLSAFKIQQHIIYTTGTCYAYKNIQTIINNVSLA